jgi:hypothetical protein
MTRPGERFAEVDEALHATLSGVLEDLRVMHVGVGALVSLVGHCDWGTARHGVAKLRELLDDLDLSLQTLERGARK